MRKLFFSALRLFLAFKVLSRLSDKISPYVEDNKIVFPTDADLRVKVAWLVVITFVVFLATLVCTISLLVSVVRFLLSHIRPSNG